MARIPDSHDVIEEVRPGRERPGRAIDVLLADGDSPEPTLLDSQERTLGLDPVDANRYYSQEWHDLEVGKVWSRTWQFAAWAYDIPDPGDIATYRNVGRSVLVVRQRDGSIRAFQNSCLHRGRELCTSEFQNQADLRCPYHGFTWRLDGNLKYVPAAWDFPQLENEAFRLPEIRCEQWNGFVFINFDADAPPLADYMGRMVGQFAESPSWDFSNRYKVVNVEKHMNLNWKTCLEGFIEAFHVAASHPQLLPMNGDAITQYDIWPDEPHFSRMITPIGVPSTNLDPRPDDAELVDSFVRTYLPELADTPEGMQQEGESARQALHRLTRDVIGARLNVNLKNKPASWLLDAVEYYLFPHFMIWPTFGAPIVYRFRPGETPEKCIWETMIFMPFEGERPPSGPTIVQQPEESLADVPLLGYLGPVLQQDVENLESLQRGLRAGLTQQVVLASYQEVRIRHLHQTLGDYVARP